MPFPAGGSTDVAARLVGDYLSQSLGQQVVVENKSGANGNHRHRVCARKSTPDGYTSPDLGPDAVSTNPLLYTMAVDPIKGLVPVVEVSHQPIALAANPSLGVSTLAELTELVRKQPGLGFATGSSVGSLQAMAGLAERQACRHLLVQVLCIAAAARPSTIWSPGTSRSVRSAPRLWCRITPAAA